MSWKVAAIASTLALTSAIAFAAEPSKVTIHFPDPTDIKDVAASVAEWSGKTMIIDRNVNGKVQILAPEALSPEDALKRFQLALTQLGLALSEHDGVTQILPARMVTPEDEQRREAIEAPDLAPSKDGVELAYEQPVDIKEVIADVAKWSGRRYVFDRNVNGKLQILSSRRFDEQSAYRAYLAGLDQLGLTEVDRGAVVQIMPQRTAKKQRELRLVAPPASPSGEVALDYPDVTEIKDVLAAARAWYGRDFVLDRNVNGKIQILAPGKLSKHDAHVTLVAALDLLGLAMDEQDGIVRVLPYRVLDGKSTN